MQCTPEQLTPVSRLLTREDCRILQEKNQSEIEGICLKICQEDSVLMNAISKAKQYQKNIHSQWFKNNPGHFVIYSFDLFFKTHSLIL